MTDDFARLFDRTVFWGVERRDQQAAFLCAYCAQIPDDCDCPPPSAEDEETFPPDEETFPPNLGDIW